MEAPTVQPQLQLQLPPPRAPSQPAGLRSEQDCDASVLLLCPGVLLICLVSSLPASIPLILEYPAETVDLRGHEEKPKGVLGMSEEETV